MTLQTFWIARTTIQKIQNVIGVLSQRPTCITYLKRDFITFFIETATAILENKSSPPLTMLLTIKFVKDSVEIFNDYFIY